jgi:hypothetical protein
MGSWVGDPAYKSGTSEAVEGESGDGPTWTRLLSRGLTGRATYEEEGEDGSPTTLRLWPPKRVQRMKFGPHSALVQEVIDFVLAGKILSEPYRHDSHLGIPVRVITSLAHVDRFRDGSIAAAEIAPDYAWYDMKLGDVEIYTRGRTSKENSYWYFNVLPEIDEPFGLMANHLETQLEGVMPAIEIEEICSHLDGLMVIRSFQGKTDSLFELLFRAYQSFGYPCGWSGDETDGALVVFTT